MWSSHLLKDKTLIHHSAKHLRAASPRPFGHPTTKHPPADTHALRAQIHLRDSWHPPFSTSAPPSLPNFRNSSLLKNPHFLLFFHNSPGYLSGWISIIFKSWIANHFKHTSWFLSLLFKVREDFSSEIQWPGTHSQKGRLFYLVQKRFQHLAEKTKKLSVYCKRTLKICSALEAQIGSQNRWKLINIYRVIMIWNQINRCTREWFFV